MLDDEKLRDLDIPVQEEINSLSWLRTVAPAFPVNGSKVRRLCNLIVDIFYFNKKNLMILLIQVTIIHKPQMFYSTLLEKCRYAKKRITFASLYLGTGTLETELVSIIETIITFIIKV